ncbi:MAG: hypothetical protein OHK0019_19170 [Saprospiraceae bacterium]
MQTALFEPEILGDALPDISEWGTFKDSLRAPVHGWFTYPAGFSHKAVEYSLREANLRIGQDTIYDPFMGSGTTNIVAKVLGFNSMGVEAHPFVFRITKSKLNWEIHFEEVCSALHQIEKIIWKKNEPHDLVLFLKNEFPELILKCFLPETLFELLLIGIASPKSLALMLRASCCGPP